VPEPTDLLLITHNRLGYVQKTLPALLADSDDYRIFWWDNASTDGTLEYIDSLGDPRLAVKHHAKENSGQEEAMLWFLNVSMSETLGKIDDDVLLPPGWCKRLSTMIQSSKRFGMLACWLFMQEDWDEKLARRRAIRVADYSVLRAVVVQGQACVARREVMQAYLKPGSPGLPINQYQMSRDGLINGMPLPAIFAHNMDDPRSPHYLTRNGQQGAPMGLTARRLGFQTHEEYACWIAADAMQRLKLPFSIQMAIEASYRRRGITGRLLRRLARPFIPTLGLVNPEPIARRTAEQSDEAQAPTNTQDRIHPNSKNLG
jgi:glycosyltransferase involved in cell wall biosynthesis